MQNACDIILNVARRDTLKAMENGSIAQLGEHLPYKQRVIGSSPIVSTNDIAASTKVLA